MQGRNSKLKGGIRAVLPLCLLGGAGVVHAMPDAVPGVGGVPVPPSNGALPADQSPTDVPGLGQPASDASLDQVRGGFDLGGGLTASFGLQEDTYINGNLVQSTRINIPDIGHITQEQAVALAATLGSLNIVQNGPGNSIAAGKAAATSNSGAADPFASLPVALQGFAISSTRQGDGNDVAGASVRDQKLSTGTATDAPQNAVGVPVLGAGNAAPAALQSTLDATAAASALAQGNALARVVQNTLNNQSIQTFTTLDVSLNTLQVLRQLNQQSTLQSAQLLSLGH